MTAEPMEDAVLRAVATHGDNYALGLMELLKVGQGIYGTLRALEGAGLLESYPRDHGMPERGGRPRIFYRLTDKARTRLRAEALT
jgi:DNA-binding PadR family transcriptional regulator